MYIYIRPSPGCVCTCVGLWAACGDIYFQTSFLWNSSHHRMLLLSSPRSSLSMISRTRNWWPKWPVSAPVVSGHGRTVDNWSTGAGSPMSGEAVAGRWPRSQAAILQNCHGFCLRRPETPGPGSHFSQPTVRRNIFPKIVKDLGLKPALIFAKPCLVSGRRATGCLVAHCSPRRGVYNMHYGSSRVQR